MDEWMKEWMNELTWLTWTDIKSIEITWHKRTWNEMKWLTDWLNEWTNERMHEYDTVTVFPNLVVFQLSTVLIFWSMSTDLVARYHDQTTRSQSNDLLDPPLAARCAQREALLWRWLLCYVVLVFLFCFLAVNMLRHGLPTTICYYKNQLCQCSFLLVSVSPQTKTAACAPNILPAC